ncbi:MAG: hypothetical protein K5787_12025 [Lentisphaeria bacterium]|nr:hypothetical protein [Lentisphaeria bacterium]
MSLRSRRRGVLPDDTAPAERDRRGAPQACHPATDAVGEKKNAAVRRPIFFQLKATSEKLKAKCKVLGARNLER